MFQFSLKKQRLSVAYLFILPGLILYLAFVIYPILKAFQMSFFDWSISPQQPNQWVGLGNYIRAFHDAILRRSFRNTVVYVLITVPNQIIFGLFFALLLDQIERLKVFFRTVYYLPVVASWVVVSLIFKYLFQSPKGVINHLLVDMLHLVQEPVPWLRYARTAFVPIWILGIWKGVGWTMVIFLAALQTIPEQFYEAAAIDGANAWQRLTRITLPLIRPTLVFVLVALMIGGFKVFIPIVMITNGEPLQRTEVVLSYMYHQAFDFLDFGYGAAISFVLAAIIMFLSYLQIKYLRRPEEAGL